MAKRPVNRDPVVEFIVEEAIDRHDAGAAEEEPVDLDPGLPKVPKMQIYKENPLILDIRGIAQAELASPIKDRFAVLEEGVARLREELAQHEADRRTELAAELDKHISQWARGRITQEHVRRTLLALIDKL